MHRFQREHNIIETIGQRLGNTRIYLLDARVEPVPLGAEGEICIGGAGVARGYLNRPEITAERFLPDPFYQLDSGSRMCRTGDHARYLPDGNLVYLGRADQQVKIRGIRIELGEIEAHLVAHADVHEAVLQLHGNGSDAQLIAYVVVDKNDFEIEILRTYLSHLLPDYMVPAAYIRLPSLPLTLNGKLDRRALPAPNVDAFVRQQYEAPQGEIEKTLADIWCELLSIDRISRYDSFFELGGHSLLVMDFVNKAKRKNMQIDVRNVYSFPILKSLAEHLINDTKRFYCDSAIAIRQYGNETPLFLLPEGWGDFSYAFELARDIDKNIPVYALPWSSPEQKQPASIEEMATKMVSYMKKVRPNSSYAIAGYSAGGILAFEIAKQLIHSGDVVSFLGLIDTFATLVDPYSESETLLSFLYNKFSDFVKFNDSIWWARVSQLPLNEAIDEILKTNLDLSGVDIEWLALASKQCCNYLNRCTEYEIESLPIEIHLFKAVNECAFPAAIADNVRNIFNLPKLGWDYYNFPGGFNITSVNGNHRTMITDSSNRSLLGKEMTRFIAAEKATNM